MKKTIWDIKKGQKYWIVFSSGRIDELTWYGNEMDKLYRDSFNAFLTEEEAIAELESRKKKAQALNPILDEAERRYLKAVIRPFRDNVKYIVKHKTLSNQERIFISFRYENIPLPCFESGTMYKGMENGKKYTLEELWL